EMVVPIDWLHVGPVKNRRWALEEGYQLQDDLSSSYFTPEGKRLRWERVAAGARGPAGEVFPEHLYGSGSDRCMLLYTMVTVPSEKRIFWNLATDNIVSLWINSDPLLESADMVDAHQGTAVLRQGRNSILIAACWPGAPSGIDFQVMDEAGLPVADMKNDLSALPPPAVAALDEEAVDTGAASRAGGSHVEIGFVLDWPEASEVSVIGEFNNWDASATPMKKTADGRWYAAVALRRGTHAYKFLVDRTARIQDPANGRSEPDGFGGTNSLIEVK
ncbi:MAG TPA: isoamylase early set domain-containing protein, partial [Candidatus Krumholzibacterium sp.]|nr:isoamylase early set domain-containing protein [Candidatus Krumholzibacterium sp.]